MIRYAMACSCGHEFREWFASMESCDAEIAGHTVVCPECGGTEVGKALMAPSVAAAGAAAAPMPMPAACGMGGCGAGMCPAMAD